jgi:hypothetical protein
MERGARHPSLLGPNLARRLAAHRAVAGEGDLSFGVADELGGAGDVRQRGVDLRRRRQPRRLSAERFERGLNGFTCSRIAPTTRHAIPSRGIASTSPCTGNATAAMIDIQAEAHATPASDSTRPLHPAGAGGWRRAGPFGPPEREQERHEADRARCDPAEPPQPPRATELLGLRRDPGGQQDDGGQHRSRHVPRVERHHHAVGDHDAQPYARPKERTRSIVVGRPLCRRPMEGSRMRCGSGGLR